MESMESLAFQEKFIADCLKKNLEIKNSMKAWRNFNIPS